MSTKVRHVLSIVPLYQDGTLVNTNIETIIPELSFTQQFNSLYLRILFNKVEVELNTIIDFSYLYHNTKVRSLLKYPRFSSFLLKAFDKLDLFLFYYLNH